MKSIQYNRARFRTRILRTLLFLASAAIIVYFFPHGDSFNYHFEEGKPWKYDLLTASFDFPIYKSDTEIELERKEILKEYQPYFTRNDSLESMQLQRLDVQLKKAFQGATYKSILSAVERCYQQGILSTQQLDSLQQAGITAIKENENNIWRSKPLSSFLTPRTAYQQISDSFKFDMVVSSLLNQIRLNDYLSANLSCDRALSELYRQEMLQQVSPSLGAILAGERIIDKGEIVTPEAFRILNSLEKASSEREEQTQESDRANFLGTILITLATLGLLFLFLYEYRRKEFNDLRSMLLILLFVVGVTVITLAVTQFSTLAIYAVPFSIAPIILVTFLDARTAFIGHLCIVLLTAFVAPFALEFIFLQTAVGLVAISSLRELVKRAQIVRTALYAFFTYGITYTGYVLFAEGSWNRLNATMFIYFAISCVFVLFAYLLIYLLERIFGYTSNVTLVELSDINAPVLRELSEMCPGTFQHSLQVSNLAAAAANRIGANAQLARTGALYHDIGKLTNPAFFTENQQGINPHHALEFEESAAIIIQHVKEGMRLASKYQLPRAITDFIATHHGMSKAKYFYNSYCNKYPDREVDESLFTYPGPLPISKECSIMMMADSVEAASRSLKEYTDASLSKLVHGIVDSQIADGQLRGSLLSFNDVEEIKSEFIDKLKIIYHTRVSYPKLNRENQ